MRYSKQRYNFIKYYVKMISHKFNHHDVKDELQGLASKAWKQGIKHGLSMMMGKRAHGTSSMN